jgi:hypothetical protein
MINKVNLERLIYWIREREVIRVYKGAGKKPPWTQDPILANYHFCNVCREDDRGTREIHSVREELDPDYDQLPTFYTAARLLNKASSLRIFWNMGIEQLQDMRLRGETVFHTAYVVSTCGASMDKLDYVQRVVDDVALIPIGNASCREAFTCLRKVDGLGSFLAGQVVADLKYTPYLRPDKVGDWRSFAVMGPGSKKGMDYLFSGGTTENNFMDRLMALRFELGEQMLDFPAIHNQDLQNCLCEFSKYMRLLLGDKGRRRPYHAVS